MKPIYRIFRHLTTGFESVKSVVSRTNVTYLDFQATTPTDPRVLEKMMPYFCEAYGNPHSRTHAFGWEAEAAVEEARAQVAELIGAEDPRDIVFTSGATESNNIAIKGVARFYKPTKSHIITAATEHKCVLDSCRALENEGFTVTYLNVGGDGRIDPKTLEAAIKPETALVSIMAVNNEIGVIQPTNEISQICKKHKVFFHTDAAQAVGKIPMNVQDGIDLLSLSGHKIYGPKGIGALYVRRRPRVRIQPLFSGGGQERGIRSGTVPTPLVVGLGEAARIAKLEMTNDIKRIDMLSKQLVSAISNGLTHFEINGPLEIYDKNGKMQRYPGCVNISFECVEGESLLMALKDYALSSGSACTSASLEPSYVLKALAHGKNERSVESSDAMAHSSIRFGIGKYTTEDEIKKVAAAVIHSVEKLRSMSPLWEMVQDGIDLNSIKWTGH